MNNIEANQVIIQDMDDKCPIIKEKSLEAASNLRGVFILLAVLNFFMAFICILESSKDAETTSYEPFIDKETNKINELIIQGNIYVIAFYIIVGILLIIIGEYLYYLLATKAYQLEFMYNNTCCITNFHNDIKTDINTLNEDVIEEIKQLKE